MALVGVISRPVELPLESDEESQKYTRFPRPAAHRSSLSLTFYYCIVNNTGYTHNGNTFPKKTCYGISQELL